MREKRGSGTMPGEDINLRASFSGSIGGGGGGTIKVSEGGVRPGCRLLARFKLIKS